MVRQKLRPQVNFSVIELQCKCLRKQTSLSCRCLSILEGNHSNLQVTIASSYMLQFFDKKREEQYTIIMDWARYSTSNQQEGGSPQQQRQLYFLPSIKDPTKNAAPLPLSLNKQKFDSTLIKEDLHNFLEHMENLAQPAATQIIRQEVGVGLRKSELDVFDLPPSFTKRSMYYQYALERGWKVDIDAVAKLTVELIEDFDGECNKICSWAYFVSYWQQNFRKLRLSNPSADVRSNTEPGSSRTFAEHNIDAFYNNTKGTNDACDVDVYSSAFLEEETVIAKNTRIIHEAVLHVNQAADQRKLANEMMQWSYDDAKNSVKHEDRTNTFVVDYCQNASLPNLGAKQPGEAYYMTPLTIPNTRSRIGGKGGDNAAHLIMMSLRQKRYLKDTSCGGELNIVMDNCQGQNKNNMVICLALLLVEVCYFNKVPFVFYIVGHTKNIDDRWFNTMKKNYRCQNLFTMGQLATALEKHRQIDVTEVKDGNFKKIDAFLNVFYKKIQKGAVQPGYIFTTINQFVYALNLKDQINSFCKSCDACQRCKNSHQSHGQLPTKEHQYVPWDTIAIDGIGPWKIKIPGHGTLEFVGFTIMDMCTNLLEIIRAPQVNLTFLMAVHALDNRAKFTSHDFCMQLDNIGIRAKVCSVQSPQANAVLENVQDTIQSVMQTAFNTNSPLTFQQVTGIVDSVFAWAQFSVRLTIHKTFGMMTGSITWPLSGTNAKLR
eukprot:jgi/Psemu1/28213/gm1.28213_g